MRKAYALTTAFVVIFSLLGLSPVTADNIRVISYNIGVAKLGKQFDNALCNSLDCSKQAGSRVHVGEALEGIKDYFLNSGQGHLKQWHVFSLQEVDNDTPRSGYINQAQEISNILEFRGEHHSYSNWSNVFTETVLPDHGAYGIATISNHQLNGMTEFDLQCDVVLDSNGSEIELTDHEKRVATFLPVISRNGDTLNIINTHLSYDRNRALCQIKRLLLLIESHASRDHAILITGDLNIRKGRWEYWKMKSLLAKFGYIELNRWLDYTFKPWGKSKYTIDYALLRDNSHTIRIKKFAVENPSKLTPTNIRQFFSDHKPIVIDLELGTEGISDTLIPAIVSAL